MLWLNILWLTNYGTNFLNIKSVRSRSGLVQAERPVFLGPDRTGLDRTNPTLLATHINGDGRIPYPIPPKSHPKSHLSHPICHNPIPIPNPIPSHIPNPISHPISH